MDEQIQKALTAVGDKNCYQYVTFGILFLMGAFVNLMGIGPTFIFMNPLFKCQGYPRLLDQSEACPIISQCSIQSNFTLAARLELYCDRQDDRDLVQFIFLIGTFVGTFSINYFAEAIGRKSALMLVQLFGIIVVLLGGQYYLFSLIVIGQIVCGLSAYPMLLQSFIYLYEICEDVSRQRLTIGINYSWCITYSMIGVLYYYYNYWFDYLLYITIIPMILTLILSWFLLVEGPVYLYRKNKIEECKKSLQFIAKINGRLAEYQAIEPQLVAEIREEEKQLKVIDALKSLLKRKVYLRVMIVLILCQSGCNLYYWGTNYAYDQVGYDFGINSIAAGIIEGLGFFSLNLIIEKLPRKKSLLILYIALSLLGCAFFFSFARDNSLVETIILAVARYLGTIAYMLVILMMTESFPGQLQSICTGIVESLAQVGSILGPVIVNMCITLQIHPLTVISTQLVIFVVIPFLFMVEPSTLRENQPGRESLLETNETFDEKSGKQM